MKSTEVYRTLREVIGPTFRAQGFSRAKTGMLGWYKPLADARFLALWCQCSQDGWDRFAGSRFVVELQLSTEPQVGTGRLRSRLGTLLSDLERSRLLRIQNEIIAALPRPPEDHPILLHSEKLAAHYRGKFEPVRAYGPNDDIWLRYHGKEDVARWAELLREVLPGALERFQEAALTG